MPPSRIAARPAESGFVAILVALMFVVLIGIAGLAIDSAHIQGAGGQLQAAADAAALAAAAQLAGETSPNGGTYTATRNAAVAVAAMNKAAGAAVALDSNAGNGATGDIVVGTWNGSTRVFTATTTSPNAVKVTARRSAEAAGGALPLIFGGAVGVASSDVSRTAIASLNATARPFVLVLDPASSGAATLSGNGVLGATGGRVHVNSSSSSGIKMSGNARIGADETRVVGNASLSGNAAITNLKINQSVAADPLASILPTVADWTALRDGLPKPAGANGKISGPGLFAPGYYPKGLSLSSSSLATLSPGTYVFGTTFSMSGQSSIIGTNVTLLCDSGVKPSLSGGANLTLTSPLIGGLRGLTLMCHRSTSGSAVLSLSGNGAIVCTGSFYVPGGEAKLSGNGAAQGIGQLVCWKLTQSGNANVSGISIVPGTSSGGGTFLVN